MASDGSITISTELDTKQLKTSLNNLGNAIKAGAAVAFTALASIGTASLKVGMNFEAAMSQVAATMGTTISKIPELTAIAKEMGATTMFSATQAAEALNYLALAGYSTEKSIAALPIVLNLAAAGGMDLAYASDLVTDSMASLGLGMSELSSFTDKMATTAQKSNTSVSQLGEGILTVGGTAKTLSGGVVELNTSLGILADNGVKGAEGGTALRNIILALVAPTDKAAGALKNLGVTVVDEATGNLLSLNDIFMDLDKALLGLGTAEKAKVLDEIFNKVDLKSVNALLKDSGMRFDELSEYIENSAGSAAMMASEMQNNLKGVLVNIGSVTEGIGIQIYEKMQVPITNAAVAFNTALSDISKSLSEGKLAVSVDKISESFSELVKSLLEMAIRAIPVLITSLASFLDIISKTKELIIAVVAGFVAFKSISTIASAINTISSGFDLANTSIGAATKTLAFFTTGTQASVLQVASANIALVAQTVIMPVLSGQIGIATAATKLFNLAWSTNPLGVVAVAISAVVASVVFLSSSLNEVSEATKETMNEIDILNASSKNLIETMESGNNTFGQTIENISEESEALRLLADEVVNLSEKENISASEKEILERKIKELNNSIPGLIQGYNDETASLAVNKEAMDKIISAKEASLKLDEQLAKQSKMKAEINKLEEERAETLANIQKITIKLREDEKLTHGDRGAYLKQLEALKISEKDMGETLDINRGLFSELGISIKNNSAIVDDAKNSESKLVKTFMATEEQLESQAKAYDKMAEHTQNAFGKIKESSSLTFDEMLENLEHNQEAVRDWSANLGDLVAKGLDEGLLAELRNLGPEGAAFVRELNSKSAEELEKLSESYKAGGEAISENLKRGAGDLSGLGSDMVDDLKDGIEGNDAAEVASSNTITDIAEAIKDKVQSSNLPSIGKNIVQGLADGIKANTSIAVSSAQSLANAVNAVFPETFRIKSPSRVMIQVGEFISMGLAKGISDTSHLAETATKKSAKSILDIEIESTTALLEEMEKRNKEMSKIKELAEKEEKVRTAKTSEERVKAEEDLNEKLQKIEEDALKERLSILQEAKKKEEDALKEAAEKAEELQTGLAEALKRKYDQAFDVVSEQYDKQLKAAESAYNREIELAEVAANEKIKNSEREYAESTKNLESYLKEREKAYEADYNARIASLDAMARAENASIQSIISALDAEKGGAVKEIQNQIDAIDKLTNAENKAAEESVYNKKLAELSKTLSTEENAEKRAKIQDDINKLITDREKKHLLERRKEEKESLKEEINQIKTSFEEQKALEKERSDNIKENFKGQKEAAKQSYDDQKMMLKERSDNEKNQLKENFDNQKAMLQEEISQKKNTMSENHKNQKESLQSEFNTQKEQHKKLTEAENLMAEAKKMINDKNQQEIINLLETYFPKWREKGKGAGEHWLLGLEATESSIKSKVDEIMSYIDQAKNASSNMDSYDSPDSALDSNSNSKREEYTSYTVKKGDNLSKIASAYGVSVNDIADINGLSNKNLLQIGQILKIPLFDKGGIVTSHMLGELAKNGKPEAIIPLDKLPGILAKSKVLQNNNQIDQGITIHFNNYGGINSDVDLEHLGKELGNRIFSEGRRRGAAFI